MPVGVGGGLGLLWGWGAVRAAAAVRPRPVLQRRAGTAGRLRSGLGARGRFLRAMPAGLGDRAALPPSISGRDEAPWPYSGCERGIGDAERGLPVLRGRSRAEPWAAPGAPLLRENGGSLIT